MATIMSRTLSVHQEHEVLLKLEAAGLDKDLAHEIITSRDNELARQMIELVRNSQQIGEKTATPEPEPKPLPLKVAEFFSATKTGETADTVTFRVKIKRGARTPQQLLDATKRAEYKTDLVVSTMPLITGEGEEEFDYVFFKPGKQTSDAAVEKERTKRHLTRDLEVHILIQAAFPEFADGRPNGDSWQDADGSWCFANFNRNDAKRYVNVNRNANDWNEHNWFGGRNYPGDQKLLLNREEFAYEDAFASRRVVGQHRPGELSERKVCFHLGHSVQTRFGESI